MCLLSVKESDQKWNYDDLAEGLASNPDGFGFAGITSEGRIRVAKGLTEAELKATLPLFQDIKALYHARYATHGATNLGQLHPYRILGDVYMAHNGIFGIPTPDKTKSDTWHMARRLAAYGEKWLMAFLQGDKQFSDFEKNIGANKVAFIHPAIGIRIANQSQGHVGPGGAWYSNYGYKPYVSDKGGVTTYAKSFGYANTAEEMVTSWLAEPDFYLKEVVLDDLMSDPEMAAIAVIRLLTQLKKQKSSVDALKKLNSPKSRLLDDYLRENPDAVLV